jgi:hypothetical protein
MVRFLSHCGRPVSRGPSHAVGSRAQWILQLRAHFNEALDQGLKTRLFNVTTATGHGRAGQMAYMDKILAPNSKTQIGSCTLSLLKRLEPGDVLVVPRLDGLARSTRDLLNILDVLPLQLAPKLTDFCARSVHYSSAFSRAVAPAQLRQARVWPPRSHAVNWTLRGLDSFAGVSEPCC